MFLLTVPPLLPEWCVNWLTFPADFFPSANLDYQYDTSYCTVKTDIPTVSLPLTHWLPAQLGLPVSHLVHTDSHSCCLFLLTWDTRETQCTAQWKLTAFPAVSFRWLRSVGENPQLCHPCYSVPKLFFSPTLLNWKVFLFFLIFFSLLLTGAYESLFLFDGLSMCFSVFIVYCDVCDSMCCCVLFKC